MNGIKNKYYKSLDWRERSLCVISALKGLLIPVWVVGHLGQHTLVGEGGENPVPSSVSSGLGSRVTLFLAIWYCGVPYPL